MTDIFYLPTSRLHEELVHITRPARGQVHQSIIGAVHVEALCGAGPTRTQGVYLSTDRPEITCPDCRALLEQRERVTRERCCPTCESAIPVDAIGCTQCGG